MLDDETERGQNRSRFEDGSWRLAAAAAAAAAVAEGCSVTGLNEYGAACRCLLRLRENEGEPGMSDAAFLSRYLPRMPEWRERPGATDLSTLLELAKEMGLGASADVFRDYDRMLEEHRAGHGIVVYTERVPEQSTTLIARRHVMIVVEADAEAFSLWCPYPSGQSDVLPRAARRWWDEWLAIAVVLRHSDVTSRIE